MSLIWMLCNHVKTPMCPKGHWPHDMVLWVGGSFIMQTIWDDWTVDRPMITVSPCLPHPGRLFQGWDAGAFLLETMKDGEWPLGRSNERGETQKRMQFSAWNSKPKTHADFGANYHYQRRVKNTSKPWKQQGSFLLEVNTGNLDVLYI